MATRAVRPIPEGHHTITPSLTVDNAAEAIEFYKRAFGAQELERATAPDGKRIWHAMLQIGDSRLFLGDEFPDMGGSPSPKTLGQTPSSLHLYVEDADAVFQRALNAGATVRMPIEDMFWGDRYGTITDPFGHEWAIATRKEEVSDEEMRRRVEAMSQSM
jgi:PhnB protein